MDDTAPDTGNELCARCGATSPRHATTCPSCGEDPRLDARYRLLARLGHGAVGTTFAAERESDGQRVAIKELLVRRLEDFKAHDLFTREAHLLRDLDHPAIPRYFDDFAAGEGRHMGLYLVTELIDGVTLEHEMQSRRHSQHEVLAIVRKLCDVLTYLHGLAPPVVHRDIKPSNVMRRHADGRLVLIDFGSVKESVRTPGDGSTVAGTFGYMPPEQLAGRASPASDIYALGVLCVTLSTRKPPHELLDDQNRLQWREHIASEPLADLLSDMLEPDPSRRLSDAAEVARRLDDILAGRAVPRARAAPAAGGSLLGGATATGNPLAEALTGQLGTLARRLGIDLERAIAPAGPGVADPPPPAPRAIPSGFAGRADPVASFFRLFGVLFGGIPLFMFLSLIGSHADALFLLLFIVIGGVLATIGFTRLARVRRLFRDGEPVPAIVTDASLDTSLKVNGRSPHKIVFRYETPDGQVREGTVSRFKTPPEFRVPGAQVYALYDRNDPARATMWPL